MPACSQRCSFTLFCGSALALLALLSVPADCGAQEIPQGPLRFQERLLTDDITYAAGVGAADLDNDGDIDLTYTDSSGHDDLNWLENTDGTSEGLVLHQLLENKPSELARHVIADLTKDGKLDVVIGECRSGDVMWLHNFDAKQITSPWKQKFIAKGGLRNTYDYVVADFDKDKDADVAALSYMNGNIVWFENDGNPANDTEWAAHIIATGLGELQTMRGGDFDGDGDTDVLVTQRMAGRVLWFENTGRKTASKWPDHTIDAEAWSVSHGTSCDLDADGDLDVLMAMGFSPKADDRTVHQIVWYENTGNVRDDQPWPRTRITVLLHAFEAVPADLDGDGDLDVVATGWAKPGRLVWCENPGDPRGEWSKHILKEGWENANQIVVADFNGDQRPDIAVTADSGTNELRWWINEGPK